MLAHAIKPDCEQGANHHGLHNPVAELLPRQRVFMARNLQPRIRTDWRHFRRTRGREQPMTHNRWHFACLCDCFRSRRPVSYVQSRQTVWFDARWTTGRLI